MEKPSVIKNHIHLSWSEIESMCKDAAERLKELDFIPDLIVTPLRGGAIPAVILSHMINVRNILTITSQRTVNDSIESKREELHLEKLTTDKDIKGKNVLLIDEIIGTGETMTKIHSHLSSLNPIRIVTVTLVINPFEMNPKNRKPDIFIKEVDKWVIFPWE